MDTITTAISTNNPKLVKDCVKQEWIIGPNEVENLIKQTSKCQSEGVVVARLELAQIAIDLKSVIPVSFTLLQDMPYNHAQNPRGLMQRMEDKFMELVDMWEKELG